MWNGQITGRERHKDETVFGTDRTRQRRWTEPNTETSLWTTIQMPTDRLESDNNERIRQESGENDILDANRQRP